MNTLAMVQARDRASQSLRDQQEKASALEHRLDRAAGSAMHGRSVAADEDAALGHLLVERSV